jgi:hypothetical protein
MDNWDKRDRRLKTSHSVISRQGQTGTDRDTPPWPAAPPYPRNRNRREGAGPLRGPSRWVGVSLPTAGASQAAGQAGHGVALDESFIGSETTGRPHRYRKIPLWG